MQNILQLISESQPSVARRGELRAKNIEFCYFFRKDSINCKLLFGWSSKQPSLEKVETVTGGNDIGEGAPWKRHFSLMRVERRNHQ